MGGLDQMARLPRQRADRPRRFPFARVRLWKSAMTDTAQPLFCDTVMPAGPAAAAVLLEPLLDRAAGQAQRVSLALDYGSPAAAGEAVLAEAWIDRATRTLIFAHARLLRASDRALVASGSAVFSRGV
jgi:acyl-coenzyme A thioesterase PaaI-like protein